MGGYGGSFGWESRHACNASSTPLTRYKDREERERKREKERERENV